MDGPSIPELPSDESMSPTRRRVLRPDVDRLDDRCLLSGLSPAQITHAYGLDAIVFNSSSGAVKGDGAGQTIALIEAYHDPNLAANLQVFDSAYGLPTPSLTVVNQAGNNTDVGWSGEEELDVEWAHAIAPGAKILVVEAASESLPDLMSALNTARNTPGVSTVSMSWGFPEFSGETAYDSYFTTPAGHTPITFVAASGDSGIQAGAEWPAASPNVLSVGGTTLNLDSTGAIASETAWSSSGGGYSQFEAEPSYQSKVQSTGQRSTPDVSFVADPRTGVSVYSTSSTNGQSGWRTVGGTSLGSPAWAAIVAIADEGRYFAGQSSLDGPSQTLPALYAVASTDYNSVSQATSSGGYGGYVWGGSFPIFFPFATTAATTSASTSNGLGTPNGTALVNDLVAVTTTSTPTSSTVTAPASTAATATKKHHKKKVVKKVVHAKTVKLQVTTRNLKAAAHEAIVDAALAELA